MDNKTLANKLLETEQIEETVAELVSSGIITTTLGPLAAGVAGVLFGVSKDIVKRINQYQKSNNQESEPIERVREKLSLEIEDDSTYYKNILTRLGRSKSLKELNLITIELSKHLKLSKEEFVALHDYLFEQRNKLQNIHILAER